MNAQHLLIDNPLEKDGILVTHPGSSHFQAEANLFLKNQDITALAPILPYSFILHNTTGRFLAGISVRFTTNVGGHTQSSHYAVRNIYRKREFMLAPAAARLFSPVFALSEGERAGSDVLSRLSAGKSMAAYIDHFVKTPGDKSITAAIDVIILDDGTVIGPDQSGLMDSMNAEIAAAKALFVAIDRMGADEVTRYLDSMTRMTVTDETSRNLAREAAALKDLRESQGERIFREYISKRRVIVSTELLQLARRNQ